MFAPRKTISRSARPGLPVLAIRTGHEELSSRGGATVAYEVSGKSAHPPNSHSCSQADRILRPRTVKPLRKKTRSNSMNHPRPGMLKALVAGAVTAIMPQLASGGARETGNASCPYHCQQGTGSYRYRRRKQHAHRHRKSGMRNGSSAVPSEDNSFMTKKRKRK